MADSKASLNDFFAKKDKKKTGKKTTLSLRPGSESPGTTRAAARTPTPEVVEPAVASPAQTATSSTIKPSIFKDDDWIVPEEKVTDYSGLRIQDLSLAETEKEPEVVEETAAPQTTGKKTWGAAKKPADSGDISTFNFPSLSQTVGDVGAPAPPGMKNFKAVKNGYKGDGPKQADRVQLTNRYAAFQNE